MEQKLAEITDVTGKTADVRAGIAGVTQCQRGGPQAGHPSLAAFEQDLQVGRVDRPSADPGDECVRFAAIEGEGSGGQLVQAARGPQSVQPYAGNGGAA